MKRLLLLPILVIFMANMPAFGMEKPKKSLNRFNLPSKLQAIGTFGLYGFIGYSIYDFIKDPKHKKLYSQDFSSLGIRYLKTSEFPNDPEILNQDTKSALSHLEKSEAEDIQKCAEAWGQKIETGETAPLYVAFINKNIGYGAFADADINENDFIGTYTGKVYSMDERRKLPREEARLANIYAWGGLPGFLSVEASHHGNELRFVNHCNEPNVTAKYVPSNDRWHVVYVAKKPLAKNEQLTVDYGYGYWIDRGEPSPLHKKNRFYRTKDYYKRYFEKIS